MHKYFGPLVFKTIFIIKNKTLYSKQLEIYTHFLHLHFPLVDAVAWNLETNIVLVFLSPYYNVYAKQNFNSIGEFCLLKLECN